jgi:RNA polymerase sigma factor for flagellar operon FliA
MVFGRDDTAPTLTDRERALVEQHLPLVQRIASRWRACRRQQVEHGDLVQIGALGLMEAARRFDPDRGESFAAFARARVEGSIRDALRAVDPLSRDARAGVRQLEQAARDIKGRCGREPEVEELAAALRWSPDSVRRRQQDLGALKAGMAHTMPQPREVGPRDAAAIHAPAGPHAAVIDREVKGAVARAIGALPARHQLVLALYYQADLTLREVGDVLRVTESRVCQLHGAAMARLRTSLRPVAA